MVVLLIIAALIALLAFGVYNLKWHFLISGYNTLPEAEKEKVDIEGLSKQTSRLLYVTAAALLLMAVAISQELEWLMLPIVVVIVGSSLVFAVRAQKFMNGAQQSKRSQKLGIIITVVTLIGVGIIMYFSLQPTTVEETKDGVTINGMYGDTFTWAQLQNATLVDELPDIAMRTNGSAVGAKLKGHFKLKSGDKAVLFVDKSKPPFITFTANDKLYYINLQSADETNALYAQIAAQQ